MSKTFVLGDEIYEYPDNGDINYAEGATGWAEDANNILNQVQGPGDIATTETSLIGTDTGTHIEGDITNLDFDTAFVQSIKVEGFITREFSDATPTRVESFTIDGAYNGTEIVFSAEFSGDDTEVEFSVNGGQFRFKYLKITNTESVRVKFSAKAKVDESFFE